MDSVILFEQPGGLPWLVAHNPATRQVACTPAPPQWGSPELAEAVTGSLTAAVDTYCRRCEAVRPAVDVPEGQVTGVAVPVPHAEWCPWSWEAIARMEEECRPPGARWEPDASAEVAERLGDYLEALAVNMALTAESSR